MWVRVGIQIENLDLGRERIRWTMALRLVERVHVVDQDFGVDCCKRLPPSLRCGSIQIILAPAIQAATECIVGKVRSGVVEGSLASHGQGDLLLPGELLPPDLLRQAQIPPSLFLGDSIGIQGGGQGRGVAMLGALRRTPP